jgi:hypothetical protein
MQTNFGLKKGATSELSTAVQNAKIDIGDEKSEDASAKRGELALQRTSAALTSLERDQRLEQLEEGER